MKEVISCSRRTDIPSCYYPWLQEVLKRGYVELVNPYNNETYAVDLNEGMVHSIVLWSKNYRNVLQEPGLLAHYNLYFQFTINGYSKFLEPNVPPMAEAIAQAKTLAEKYSSEQINWRFDPIIISQQGEVNPSDPLDQARLDIFDYLCKELSSVDIRRCTISFVDLFEKVKERFGRKGFVMKDMPDNEKIKFAEKLVAIANKYSVKIFSCSSPIIERVEGISKGHCIDGEVLESLFGQRATHAKDAGQRTFCGCTKSKDIGAYDKTCKHGCLYCYARPE